MAPSRRTYTAAEAARYILEGDGSDRNCGKLRYVYKLGSVSLSGKILMTADANNNNCRVPVTGKCVHVEIRAMYSIIFVIIITYRYVTAHKPLIK